MKTRLFILLMALAFSISNKALAQDFNTGSSLMNTGSAYSSNIYGVGAAGVDPMATTAAAPNRGRMAIMDDDGDEESGWGNVGDNTTPIGAPYIMLLFAAGAAGVVTVRKRK